MILIIVDYDPIYDIFVAELQGYETVKIDCRNCIQVLLKGFDDVEGIIIGNSRARCCMEKLVKAGYQGIMVTASTSEDENLRLHRQYGCLMVPHLHGRGPQIFEAPNILLAGLVKSNNH